METKHLNFDLDIQAHKIMTSTEGYILLDNILENFGKLMGITLIKNQIPEPIVPDIVAIVVASIVSSSSNRENILQQIANAFTTYATTHGEPDYKMEIIQHHSKETTVITGKKLKPEDILDPNYEKQAVSLGEMKDECKAYIRSKKNKLLAKGISLRMLEEFIDQGRFEWVEQVMVDARIDEDLNEVFSAAIGVREGFLVFRKKPE